MCMSDVWTMRKPKQEFSRGDRSQLVGLRRINDERRKNKDVENMMENLTRTFHENGVLGAWEGHRVGLVLQDMIKS